ncbi:MAG TPA: AMP-binding protein, partial [Polyangiales bacterium]|nr:AMP-binding protein [Polyangiales bacterium]
MSISAKTDEIVWRPSAERIERANVTRLMRKLGYAVDATDPAAVEREARAFVQRSGDDPEWFWNAALEDMQLAWDTPYSRLLDVSHGPEHADWFLGGRVNLVSNCVDRHARGSSARAQKAALIAETEDGATRSFTFAELDREVCRLANGLARLGVGEGDRVASYMPMVAEVVIAMLATQKLGAVFVPIFSGYAPPSVRERLDDGEVKVVFTADGSMRRGKAFPLKAELDRALVDLACVQHVVVYRRIGAGLPCPMLPPRDVFWDELVDGAEPERATLSVAALAPALMLYTSGTTGKPKGTIHTHAGCLAQMGKELLYNFDLHDDDVFFWFTDIGWMMGPWEIIGCLMHGTTIVVFEGAPDYPAADRVWRSVERHGVTTLGISPTAIRLLMRAGDELVDAAQPRLVSLRMLGSTGEPWDPESYLWYANKVGAGRCPVINISGGTDIAGCFLAPLPIMPLKATSLQCAGLGMAVDVFDEAGRSVRDEVGYLVCKKPSPSMTRSLWKNDAKYLETYWSKFPGVWNHGDWARHDADGHFYLLGRADDTLKIAGRRVGPGELEAALIAHPAVSEAAAVGVPDPLKGTDVVCFVVLHRGATESEALRAELVQHVVDALGKVDRPKQVLFSDDLPKTRSAKILRRLIQRVHLGDRELGDLSSV